MPRVRWEGAIRVDDPREIDWTCAFCGALSGATEGFRGHHVGAVRSAAPQYAWIVICSRCGSPTYVDNTGACWPAATPMKEIRGLPVDVERMLREARLAAGAGAPTASAMACRKILMHIAVQKGQPPGEPFAQYVGWLTESGFLPKEATPALEVLRTRGNGANHDLTATSPEEASDLIWLAELVLTQVYEVPERVKKYGRSS